jgi:hypothetical protein
VKKRTYSLLCSRFKHESVSHRHSDCAAHGTCNALPRWRIYRENTSLAQRGPSHLRAASPLFLALWLHVRCGQCGALSRPSSSPAFVWCVGAYLFDGPCTLLSLRSNICISSTALPGYLRLHGTQNIVRVRMKSNQRALCGCFQGVLLL